MTWPGADSRPPEWQTPRRPATAPWTGRCRPCSARGRLYGRAQTPPNTIVQADLKNKYFTQAEPEPVDTKALALAAALYNSGRSTPATAATAAGTGAGGSKSSSAALLSSGSCSSSAGFFASQARSPSASAGHHSGNCSQWTLAAAGPSGRSPQSVADYAACAELDGGCGDFASPASLSPGHSRPVSASLSRPVSASQSRPLSASRMRQRPPSARAVVQGPAACFAEDDYHRELDMDQVESVSQSAVLPPPPIYASGVGAVPAGTMSVGARPVDAVGARPVDGEMVPYLAERLRQLAVGYESVMLWVIVECCRDCARHKANFRHKQEDYINRFLQLRALIYNLFGRQAISVEMLVPWGSVSREGAGPKPSPSGRAAAAAPRIRVGAFEVYFCCPDMMLNLNTDALSPLFPEVKVRASGAGHSSFAGLCLGSKLRTRAWPSSEVVVARLMAAVPRVPVHIRAQLAATRPRRCFL